MAKCLRLVSLKKILRKSPLSLADVEDGIDDGLLTEHRSMRGRFFDLREVNRYLRELAKAGFLDKEDTEPVHEDDLLDDDEVDEDDDDE
jgi:hypothetical protein